MYNKFLISAFLVLLLIIADSGKLSAQQEPQFTHNMFNFSSVNPGHFGLMDGICVTGLMREQWLGFKDDNGNKVAPETFLVSADAPIRFIHGGVGVAIVQDKYGFFKDMSLKLGYAYHTTIGAGKLGIGINASFLNKSSSFTSDNIQAIDMEDPAVKALLSAKSILFTDFSAGAFLINPTYYLSISSTQILETSKFLDKTGQQGNFKLRRHYYAAGGYNLTSPAYPGYVFTPSVFVKSDGAALQADFNALVTYNKKVWGGMTYRIGETVALMVGFRFNDIEIGYSYDIPMTRVGATGSHEIMARYVFKLEREKARTGYRNTRFL